MYMEQQQRNAIGTFDRFGFITATIRQLGYPSRTMTYIGLRQKVQAVAFPRQAILEKRRRPFVKPPY